MKKVLGILLGGLTSLSFISPAFAVSINTPCVGNQFNRLCNLEGGSIGPIIGSIINLIFLIAGILALVFLVIGGIKWITSEGDTKNVEAARNQIIAAAVGLGVTFLSYLIINLLLTFFLNTNLGSLQIPTLGGS